MFDDFCSECQFRQNPVTTPMGQGGCGAQFPMQGPMMVPSMQGPGGMNPMTSPLMQGTMMPGMQGPMMPGMQIPGNIYQNPMTQGPMGTPTPGQTSGMMPQSPTSLLNPPTGPSPVPGETFIEAPGSPVYRDIRYMQGYLRTLIGRFVRVEFLIGTEQLRDREGTLLDVGISYIVLREAQSDDNVMCDLFSIKFVTVFL